MKIWSLITARGGSKGVPRKNVRALADHSLIAWSIVASRQAKHICRTVVSTDCLVIADVSRQYGAEVPFIRPTQYATDTATDTDVFQHAISWFQTHEDDLPDLIVHLRPTTPLRNPALIDVAIEQFVMHGEADSMRSAHRLEESPAKMFTLQDTGRFVPYIRGMSIEDTNRARQSHAPVYVPNGYVDIIKPVNITKYGNIHGQYIQSFVTQRVIEIDTMDDLREAELYAHKSPIYLNLEMRS